METLLILSGVVLLAMVSIYGLFRAFKNADDGRDIPQSPKQNGAVGLVPLNFSLKILGGVAFVLLIAGLFQFDIGTAVQFVLSAVFLIIIVLSAVSLIIIYRRLPTSMTTDNQKSSSSSASAPPNADEMVRQLVREHGAELLRKRRQLIEDAGYGKKNYCKWWDEQDRFYRLIIRNELGDVDRAVQQRASMVVKPYVSSSLPYRAVIDAQLDELARKSVSTKKPDTGVDFEEQCANTLEEAGWKVQTTKASGDQGADIIAESGAKKVVLQCKLYSKPVGNKAVQEVQAALAHYGATHAAVVTNASYTTAAKELAASNCVLLLHPEDLPRLGSMLS